MRLAAAALLAALHVAGPHLVAGGRVVHLHGVNRSGTEYACVQSWGIFDGPADEASVAAIASWRVNLVRVPLNEDCWLGIDGVRPQYGGAAYRRAIVAYVNLLHRHGIYAELSLIWAAPGAKRATSQPAAPDADHAPATWASLAATFRSDPAVILAPWGEPTVGADCFLRGGDCGPYRVAGMQQAVTIIRQAGFRGPLAIPGIDYANDLSQWLAHEPRDPLHQLVAEAHVYGKNACDTVACFDRTIAPVARRVPVLFAEVGESWDDSDCGSAAIARIVGWAEAHAAGEAAWTWDTWGTCGSLIRSYDGTPANAYGAWVRGLYVSR